MAATAFNSGKFMEKVTAMATYDSALLQKLYKNPVNKQKINRGAALLVKNYFNQYMDSKASQSYMSYHHVYEFDKVGDPDARLFNGVVTNTPDGSAIITYSFTQAKDANREGYPFPNKAEVMEKGDPVVIYSKRGKYLRYMLKNGDFVISPMSYVPHPGGASVKRSFQKTFNRFIGTQASFVLTRARYFQRIEQAMIQERRLVIPRINKGMTTDAIQRATLSAAKVANGVPNLYA